MNNFHTHSKRCNHAVGVEEDYVKSAIEAGYKRLGFSEHMPLPPKDEEWSHRLSPYEIDEYVNEVLRLKEKYKDQIEIFLSLEFEYFYNRIDWVDYLIDKYPLDYTIGGNHFYKRVSDNSYFGRFDKKSTIDKYYEQAKLLLESNKFDIFAHPDLFFDSYPIWDEKSKQLSKDICRLAKENDVILEYNLGGIKNKRQYPNEKFWAIAIKENNKIIVGVDAHDPRDFNLGHHKMAIDYLQKKGANLLLDLNI